MLDDTTMYATPFLGGGSVGGLEKWKGFILQPLGRNFFGREVDRASRTASKGLVRY